VRFGSIARRVNTSSRQDICARCVKPPERLGRLVDKEMTSAGFIHSRFDDAGLTPAQFRLTCHMLRRAGGDGGLFYGSIPNSAKTCRMDPKTARLALKEILKLNVVEIVSAPAGRVVTYRVNPIEKWKIQPLPKDTPLVKTGRVVKRIDTPTNPPPTPLGKTDRHPTQKTPTKVFLLRSSNEVNPTKGENAPLLEKMLGWQLRKDLRETSDPVEREAIRAELKRRRGTGNKKSQAEPATVASSTEVITPKTPKEVAKLGTSLADAMREAAGI